MIAFFGSATNDSIFVQRIRWARLRSAFLAKVSSNFRQESATGSITRFVRILNPTPSEAVMASSRIMGIGTSNSVMNETNAVISARTPGMRSPLKLARAAVMTDFPLPMPRTKKLICWTPCDTPMANTRNGTSTASGSSPYPISRKAPNCQIIDVSEHMMTRTVRRKE